MAITIDYNTDLKPFAPGLDPAQAAIMITDALALAAEVAPCITDSGFTKGAAAKAIIRGAILRWNDAGSGASVQLGAGQFQQTIDTRQKRRGMYWPSEITDLQKLCQTGKGQAFTIDTYPPEPVIVP